MSAAATRLPAAAVILLYHQIGTRPADPFRQFVTAEHFAGHMEALAGLRPTGLRALVRQLRDGAIEPGTVVVTFDDGYRNNLHLAKPALERAGVPATVFVTSGMSGATRDFWWNDLGDAFAQGVELRIAVGAERHVVRAADDRPERLFELWEALRRLTAADAQATVAGARRAAGLPAVAAVADDARLMTVDELHELVDGGLIEVGAHTRTHPMLSALAPSAQREEIAGSRADLEAALERPVSTFAYPFGGRVTEYRAAAVRAVARSGFEAAVAVAARRVERRSSPLELPRHPVPDIPPDEFAAWLAERLRAPRGRRGPLELGLVRALRERVAIPGRL